MQEDEGRNLRHTLGRFVTGVAVVTTRTEAMPTGLTINSFSSVSLDPPLILWSLSRDSARLEVFQQAEYFAVNVLAGDQIDLCRHFSSTKENLFTDIAWQPSKHGQPILDGWWPVWNARRGKSMRAAIISSLSARFLPITITIKHRLSLPMASSQPFNTKGGKLAFLALSYRPVSISVTPVVLRPVSARNASAVSARS